MARNLAVSTAHRNAFLILLSRLKMDEKIANQIKDEEISDMVRSQYIADEVMSGNNYSANFDITFGRDFVEYSLNKRKIKKDGAAAEKDKENKETYLLIPVKISGKKVLLWEETNDWRNAIEKTLLNNSQEKLVLAYNDIENIATINRFNILNINYARLEPLISRYKTNGAYLLFFSDDELTDKVKVDVSYISKIQSKQMKLSFVNIKQVDDGNLISIIAKKTVEYVENLNMNDINKIGKNELFFEARIRNLGDWLTIKNRIENSGLVNELMIQAISHDEAKFKVNYSGANSNIITSFAEANIALEEKGRNSYIVKLIQNHENQR
jgi:hypothetical protein